MSTQKMKSRVSESSRSAVDESASEEVRDRLAGLLPADALQDALAGLRPEEITGPGGLVSQLAGRVIETALGAELTEHPGYLPGQRPPGGARNHRHGHTPAPAPAPATRPRRCRRSSGPCRSRRRATARARSSPGSWASARRAWRG